MDSKTKFNRLRVCHPSGAGLGLPPARHSSRILPIFVPLFTLLSFFLVVSMYECIGALCTVTGLMI